VIVVLAAFVLVPDHLALLANVFLGDRPRPREGIVGDSDLVEERILGGFVEPDALLHHGLVVAMQRQTGRLEIARALEVAGLDLEQVVAAIAVLVLPIADRVADHGRLLVGREAAAVSIDAARHVALEDDVGHLRLDDELDWPDHGHHPRHAVGCAGDAGVLALAALGLIGEACLEDRLIFCREWRLLVAAWPSGLVPLDAGAGRAFPLARPVGIFRGVLRARERAHERDRCDQAKLEHGHSSVSADAHRHLASSLKYFRSGGAWPLRTGIRKPSALT
jgi:hypothetical protein